MLLPHGYEGQGPEHSSARLERYLQLCAENNMQVCYPTTPAQYFHLLRRQVEAGDGPAADRDDAKKPAATAGGSLDDGRAQDRRLPARDRRRRSHRPRCGKTRRHLQRKGLLRSRSGREESHDKRVAIVRLEQFYPFPGKALAEIVRLIPECGEIVWTQEEPQNMGGWAFVEPRLREILPATTDASLRRPCGIGFARDGLVRDPRTRAKTDREQCDDH